MEALRRLGANHQESFRRFASILGADLRERTRSARFWVILGLVCAATWMSFPDPGAGYITVSFGAGVRGAYSSAWIGMVLAVFFGVMLSLFGFYLVRGTVVRDFETRVWQLLVATPMTRAGFLLAKWTSHMVVFAAIMAAGLAVGLVAQFVRAEDRAIDLFELVKPTVLLALPGLAMTAMFAVLFDVVPWLRRTGGNVAYFFVWIFLLSISVANIEKTDGSPFTRPGISDPNGSAVLLRDARRMLPASITTSDKFGINIGIQVRTSEQTQLVSWTHWSMQPIDYAGRLFWLALALGGTLLAAPFLDKAAAHAGRAAQRASGAGLRLRWLDRLLWPLGGSRVGVLAAAEVKGVLRARRRFWWLAMLGLMAGQVFAPGQGFAMCVIGAWLLSMDAFARLGLREREHGTAALVYTAPAASAHLGSARALASLLLAWGFTLPAMVRMATTLPEVALAIGLAGATLALGGLALAAACRNPRPYELAVIFIAYISAQGEPLLNVMAAPGTTLAIHAVAVPVCALLVLVLWPRMRPAH
jgi:hypothetical protein